MGSAEPLGLEHDEEQAEVKLPSIVAGRRDWKIRLIEEENSGSAAGGWSGRWPVG